MSCVCDQTRFSLQELNISKVCRECAKHFSPCSSDVYILQLCCPLTVILVLDACHRNKIYSAIVAELDNTVYHRRTIQ